MATKVISIIVIITVIILNHGIKSSKYKTAASLPVSVSRDALSESQISGA